MNMLKMKRVSDYEYVWKKPKPKRRRRPRRDPSGLPCLNCDRLLSRECGHPYMYCSERCSQTAHYVRRARRCERDGRVDRQDVRDALQIQRAMVLSGGYPKKERHIPKKLRDEVYARYEGRCARCGEAGTEIDHIEGSSNSLKNLQLLCHHCHTDKTKGRLGPITDLEPAMREIVENRETELDERIDAKRPLRPCDDDLNWDDTWREIARGRSATALAAAQVKQAS